MQSRCLKLTPYFCCMFFLTKSNAQIKQFFLEQSWKHMDVCPHRDLVTPLLPPSEILLLKCQPTYLFPHLSLQQYFCSSVGPSDLIHI